MTRRIRRAMTYLTGLAGCILTTTGCPPKVAQGPTLVASNADPNIPVITIDSVELADERYQARSFPLRGVLGAAKYVNKVQTRPTPGLLVPIDSMRDTALVDYLNSLKYDGSHHNSDLKYVACTTAAGMCSPFDSIAMFIQPEIGIRHIQKSGVTKYGMVVAHIINYASDPAKQDIRFGIPGNGEAWWVIDSMGGRIRSRFFVRTYQAFPAVQMLTGFGGVVEHTYDQCNHPKASKYRPSKAAWANCTTDLLYALAPIAPVTRVADLSEYVHAVAFRPGAAGRPMAVTLDGGWGTCSQWCCASQ